MWGVCLAPVGLVVLVVNATLAEAAVVRVEGESASCSPGTVTASTGASGGSTRLGESGVTMACTLGTVAQGEEFTIVQFSLRRALAVARVFDLRLVGGETTRVTLGSTGNQLEVVSWGPHPVRRCSTVGGCSYPFEIDPVSNESVELDYLEVTTSTTPTTTTLPTTTTVPPTTVAPTTTVAPATTTTVPGPTTTTTPPAPGAGYATTQTDVQVAGAVFGLGMGVLVGATLFHNTYRDNDR